jgi:hypothetical protein
MTTEQFAKTQGTNVQITLPSVFSNFNNVSDKPILVYLFVDGSHNGYIQTPRGSVNELGFCVYEGSHRVSLQILDPPLVPEMSMPILELICASLFLEALQCG